MRKENKAENLTVDFYKCYGGWLCFKLNIGEQSFDDRFSHVFDPLLDLKNWLEAISTGVKQTSFNYDNEGTEFKFDFERVYWKKEVLTISETHENGKELIKATVDRKQIVKSFYLGLLTFASSDKFKSEEWEIEYLKERLCDMLNIDEETLIEQLADLDKKELGKLLFNANPMYWISFPEAKDKNEECDMFIQDIDDKNNEIVNELKRAETPMEWNIPDEYNFWTTDKKRHFVIQCINETTHGYDGMKIKDFRSSIIEKYLDEE